ncbi:hypothetical protein, partial [Citrobacter portucalensis]|uniref:hypothetical protein n=1 Tax=Citrobacter portucalensis TaxID=1639133 RepID=UPI0035A313E4
DLSGCWGDGRSAASAPTGTLTPVLLAEDGEATPEGRGRRRRGKSGAGRGGQAERGGRKPGGVRD